MSLIMIKSKYVQVVSGAGLQITKTIFLEDNGIVSSSFCECPMGQYKCHHVAATLLFGFSPKFVSKYIEENAHNIQQIDTIQLDSELSSDGSMTLKETHDYWHQIQGQLFLTGTQCCDLVLWTPKGLQIVRIVKDMSWFPNISLMKMTPVLDSLDAQNHQACDSCDLENHMVVNKMRYNDVSLFISIKGITDSESLPGSTFLYYNISYKEAID
ncbi:hypothetical protein KUTeg_005713 [Tegillarca granosa]|uniref:SWIM-type domain-containing protein n=1 Tax=Tegillarca granosa TaxID=220873 RepID=A0ABQ9FLG8_TEGGR|nr:hypothetical protein KUTeg_005713 [Tegillarca granosa]